MQRALYRYRRFKINTLTWLLDRAVLKTLRQHNVCVIAVTGSLGKTTAKVAISQLLSSRWPVYVEEQNRNSDRAVRLSFFGLETPDHSRRLSSWLPVWRQVVRVRRAYPYRVSILELAESRYQTLRPFAEKIKPHLAVITGVTPAHMAFFKTYERVQRAVWSLAEPAKAILYNQDFTELVDHSSSQADGGFGVHTGYVHFTRIRRNSRGTLDAKLWIGQQSVEVSTQLVAEQSLGGLAAAVLVAHRLDWSLAQIRRAIPAVRPVAGRMQALRAHNGALLLDDSFNASPLAVAAALRTLQSFRGRKIAVLGSMNELGADAVEAHQAIGRQAAGIVDELIVVGEVAGKYLASAARQAGLTTDKIHIFTQSNQTIDCLRQLVRPGDTVLFKGSQGAIYIEEAIKVLLPTDTDIEAILVRQKGSWRRRKRGYFAENLQEKYA